MRTPHGKSCTSACRESRGPSAPVTTTIWAETDSPLHAFREISLSNEKASSNEKSDLCCPETPLRDNFSGYLTSVLPQPATTPSSMSSRMELLSVEYKTAGTRSMGSTAVNADKNVLFIFQWHQSIFVKIRNFTNRMTEIPKRKTGPESYDIRAGLSEKL